MARKSSGSKKNKTAFDDNLSQVELACLDSLERARSEARKAYETFLGTARDLPSLERAEAWLRHVIEHPDNDGDLEALVYLVSRGYDCGKYISRTVAEWKEAELNRIQENASELKTPNYLVDDIANSSSYLLRDFWTCHRSQEDAIDATMLRTVEWCGIGGFEPWWQRVAKSAREMVLKGGVEPLRACFWLFNMCRSPYAIHLMPRVLDRCLEGIEFNDEFQRVPWIHSVDRGEIQNRRLGRIEHIYHAASIAACDTMLSSCNINTSKEWTESAARALQKHQLGSGAWAYWADSIDPSVEVTAVAVHALCLVQPTGYSRNCSDAVAWLLTQQDLGGFWRESACPDPAYLTVLVLDAIALASGENKATFRGPASASSLTNREGKQQTGDASRFKVAFSFPGEARRRVEQIARLVAQSIGQDHVFYDEWYKAELAIADLDLHLQDIYRNQSKLLVVFLSANYEKKEWCGLEWRAIREFIKSKERLRLMFLRLDDAHVSGIYSHDGYVDIRDIPDSQIAELILARIN
jgi:hypothetical protein